MLRVIKLGGSLLERGAQTNSHGTKWQSVLLKALLRWLSTQIRMHNVLIVGGGQRVEVLRRRSGWINNEAAHWEAVGYMESNGRDLARQLSVKLVDDVCSVMEAEGPFVVLGKIESMLRDGNLPESWAVTSDSIAAWIACRHGASELVLLKSRDAHGSAQELANAGIVDNYFPTIASQISYRIVNLRRWATRSRI